MAGPGFILKDYVLLPSRVLQLEALISCHESRDNLQWRIRKTTAYLSRLIEAIKVELSHQSELLLPQLGLCCG